MPELTPANQGRLDEALVRSTEPFTGVKLLAGMAGVAQLQAEVERLRTENRALRNAVAYLHPVAAYVSRGRRYVDIEPYPDAGARRALGVLADLGLLPPAPTDGSNGG